MDPFRANKDVPHFRTGEVAYSLALVVPCAEHRPEVVREREAVLDRMRSKGLLLSTVASSVDDSIVYILVTAPGALLATRAEQAGLRKRLRRRWALRAVDITTAEPEPFTRARVRDFELDDMTDGGTAEAGLFSSLERQRLIVQLIEEPIPLGGCGMQLAAAKGKGLVDDFFFLHDPFAQACLLVEWVEPFLEFPRHFVHNYVGDKVALYFEFLAVYTRYLSVLVLLCAALTLYAAALFAADDGASGSLAGLSERLQRSLDNAALPIYVMSVSLWTLVLLKAWRFRNAELKFDWNLDESVRDEPSRFSYASHPLAEEHTGFHAPGEGGFVPVADEPGAPRARVVPPAVYTTRRRWGALLTLMVIALVVTGAFLLLGFRTFLVNVVGWPYLGLVIGSMATAAFITGCNQLWSSVGVRITEWELHRTESAFEDALVWRTFLFKFINSYTALFYIAFWKTSNLAFFGDEALVDECQGSCMLELLLQMIALTIGNDTALRHLRTLVLPRVQSALRRLWYRSRRSHYDGGSNGGSHVPSQQLSRANSVLPGDEAASPELQPSPGRRTVSESAIWLAVLRHAEVTRVVADLRRRWSRGESASVAPTPRDYEAAAERANALFGALSSRSNLEAPVPEPKRGASGTQLEPPVDAREGRPSSADGRLPGTGSAQAPLARADGAPASDRARPAPDETRWTRRRRVDCLEALSLRVRDMWFGAFGTKLSRGELLDAKRILAMALPDRLDRERALPEYEGTLSEVSEMVVQFGYITMFAVAFPPGSVVAWFNNLVESKTDARKLVSQRRRARYTDAASLETWEFFLEMLAYFSILTNMAILWRASDSLGTFAQGVGLEYRTDGGDVLATRLVVVVLLEHALIAVRVLMDKVLPDTPWWIVRASAQARYYRRKLLAQEEARDAQRRGAAPTRGAGAGDLGGEPAVPAAPTPAGGARGASEPPGSGSAWGPAPDGAEPSTSAAPTQDQSANACAGTTASDTALRQRGPATPGSQASSVVIPVLPINATGPRR